MLNQQPKIGDVWYRYMEFRSGSMHLREDTYVVEKVTPKGVWVRQLWGTPETGYRGSDRTFVLLGVGKRKAHPTKQLAMESFIARKQRQARIYKARLNEAQIAAQLGKFELSRINPELAPAAAESNELLPLLS